MGHSGKVRIALVHYSAPPVVGGVETVLGEHARLLRAAGHTVQIVCGTGGGDCVLAELRERATCAEKVHAALRPLFAGQDVVVLHNVMTMPFHPGLTGALWQLAGELPAVRFLSWVHDLAAAGTDDALAALPAEDAQRLRSAHLRVEYVCISEDRRSSFKRLTGTEARVVPNGVDPLRRLDLSEHLHTFCREHRVIEREITLLHPARFLRRKNIECSMRILGALRTMGCDALLLVTGAHDPHRASSRAYAETLRELRRELEQARTIHFLHDLFHVTPADLHRLFEIADALIFPSQQEGFGLPVLESAWHRLPIFCADRAPMSSLLEQSIETFETDAPPEKVATQILQRVQSCPLTQRRKEVVRRYAWAAIYEKLLAPLLAETRLTSG